MQTKWGCPHNCCYCVYTLVEGKQVRINHADEVVAEIRQLYDREVRNFWWELEKIFGADKVEPAIFFIGLQPHTHLEDYALKQEILQPGYDPMSLMPWTAKKLL